MDNFVLLYHFEDKKAEQVFEKEIADRFSRHTTEQTGNVRYFGFAERAEPAAVDKLNTILNRVDIGTKDYVALYHAGKSDPDMIQRQMLVGHDTHVEKKVQRLSEDAHRDSLSRLLEYRYDKVNQQPKNRS
ncbi:hypothetical protein [Cesiribacter andamanensis]|uniref:Uncharacterized protein n=1 Tax=Cesiribacter andamanensis AMV16 TaxID=1279009 RepID=M7NST6_9BACT|nr:hypothetical protein [Cesiribacter andamanensis]EMR04745.1 hypothetical protein ADICEAN_00016 [Cesiribacter andamanensis AMV16]